MFLISLGATVMCLIHIDVDRVQVCCLLLTPTRMKKIHGFLHAIFSTYDKVCLNSF